ncbi:putative tuberous sclerosis 1 [Rosellinia necatrix]|uniref:Putative tuberous sclerosis 1 n=1 Tax=Rosellinia necatrix TaxID=77044 RepID=A0A1W2TPV4_ROSNE|nr:putative tuberous sclerosis 1 [Rosellinia necatrix]
MSAAPTLKELVKAVGSFAHSPSLPLPDDLVQIIEAFLDNRADKWDESVAEKVHDELLSVFKQDIAQDPARYAAFIALLRHLRPLVGQPARVLQWFDLLLPVLAHLIQEKDLASECQGILLDILTGSDGNDKSSFTQGAAAPIAERIIYLWFDEVELLRKSADALQDFKEKHLRDTLILYGKKRPKDFMTVVDRFVCESSHRASSLLLLASFVQSQPPHLYLILQTPLFGNLLNCLQRDTSTTIISLALTVLTMVLPHIPSSLVPNLPTLFNIYARFLFWERELSAYVAAGKDKERIPSSDALDWEVCSFSSDVDDTSISQLLNYFTILYGLYPINFMDYIRKPQRYLRHAEASDPDVIEVQPTEIRHASERFRKCHLLHENFYTLTIDSEKTDFGRWIKSEPAEVVADCMALRQLSDELPDTISLDLAEISNTDGDESDKIDKGSALLSSSYIADASGSGEIYRSTGSPLSQPGGGQTNPTAVRHSSQSSHQSKRDSSSTRLSENENDNLTLSRQLVSSGSQTQLQDLINSNKAVKSSLHQSLANDSVPSLSLSYHDTATETQSPPPHFNLPNSSTESHNSTIINKQRKLIRYVYLLYNDLVFERFLKQQHLTHIGELRRRHVREAASEAETQNIITANKHLKQRLDEAKKAEIRAKTEGEKSRMLAKKWEADIFNKLKTLREEQKKWSIEKSTLEVELKVVKDEAEALRTLVCEVEVRELRLKQNIQSADVDFGELERLRSEVKRLTESERDHQAKETERQAAMTQAAEADSRAEVAKMQLAAREFDFQRTQELHQSQIIALNSKLQEVLKNDGRQKTENLDLQLGKTLEASRVMQTELKKRIHDLSRKNAELQNKIFEIEAKFPTPSADVEDDQSSNSSSVPAVGDQRRQSFSEPEPLEGTSYNATPPLEPIASASTQTRSPTPRGMAESSTNKGSPSPTEQHIGRGGFQNLRRDKKEKKEDRGRKKSTGMRSIRGFV